MTIKKIIGNYQSKKRKNQHKSAVARKWAAALLLSTDFFYFQTISTKRIYEITGGYIHWNKNKSFFCCNRAEFVLYKKARSPPSNLKF